MTRTRASIGLDAEVQPSYLYGFDDIRDLFAQTNEADLRVIKGRFSLRQGRPPKPARDDQDRALLPDVYVACEVCHGTRYNSETSVHCKENISAGLDMTVNDAEFFHLKINAKFQTIKDVGLGYNARATGYHLSERASHAREVSQRTHKRSTGKSFYILDEPTTGLHTEDVARLLKVLARFVDDGNIATSSLSTICHQDGRPYHRFGT